MMSIINQNTANVSSVNEWVAPYSIEECGHRLLAVHEKFSFFATNYAYRTTVKLEVIDNYRYDFALRRIQKKNLLENIGPFVLRGTLEYQNPTSTTVRYRLENNLFLLLIGLVFIPIFIIQFIIVGWFALFFMAIISVALLVQVIFTFRRIDFLKKQLMNTLSLNSGAYYP